MLVIAYEDYIDNNHKDKGLVFVGIKRGCHDLKVYSLLILAFMPELNHGMNIFH